MRSLSPLRRFTPAAALSVLSVACARAGAEAPPPPVARATLLSQALADHPGEVATVTTVELGPGASSPPHRHPGPLFVYVAEGEIESQLDGAPIAVYAAGQAFFEPANALHRLTRNPSRSRRAVLVVFALLPSGQPLTLPVH